MGKYKFYAKICSDGRLYNGGMTLVSVIPNPLPPNTVALDDVPEDIEDGSNYLWDGETLIHSPPPLHETDEVSEQ